MSDSSLRAEIEDGVAFSCFVEGEEILGVMEIQDIGPVILIRHAYVRSSARRRGIGAELLSALAQTSSKPVLIGTWKAATWAVAFYEKHGFTVLPDGQARTLLEQFWNVPARQMETSVVLANEAFAASAIAGTVLFSSVDLMPHHVHFMSAPYCKSATAGL